ncbi:MAG: hypothetical protein RSB38_00275 [Oscillospiraceae bacterium]
MSNNFYSLNEIKQIPIIDVINVLGLEIQNKNGLWVKVRNEKTASCKIYDSTNTYCDFGNGNKGGDIISLVEYVKECSNKEAIEFLAKEFMINSFDQSKEFELTENQFKKIGIESSNVLNNMNIENVSLKTQFKILEQFNMSVSKFKEQNNKAFLNLLKCRAIPFVLDLRHMYYFQIYCAMRMATILGIDILTLPEELVSIKEESEKCIEAEALLIKALGNSINEVNFKPHKYDVIQDIMDIRTGKINVEVGNLTYSELKEKGEPIIYKKISIEDYTHKMYAGNTSDFKFAAFVQGSKVNLAYTESEVHKIETVLSEQQAFNQTKTL